MTADVNEAAEWFETYAPVGVDGRTLPGVVGHGGPEHGELAALELLRRRAVCVTTTLSGTTAAGDPVETTTTLTVVAGVDPEGVDPCDPTDPTRPMDPIDSTWPVTDRTVLSSGYVGPLGRVSAIATGATVETVVRDDSEVRSVEDELDEVVLDVSEAARQQIPADPPLRSSAIPAIRYGSCPIARRPTSCGLESTPGGSTSSTGA
ncbi:hypothetical protein MT994_03745 [Cellulosimicrobium sp. MI9406]|uniref:hypothetical protein n=1 Tax=Cellulosimicrobium sp. MI9406 TaxID=2931398 RepID=UPI0033A38E9A